MNPVSDGTVTDFTRAPEYRVPGHELPGHELPEYMRRRMRRKRAGKRPANLFEPATPPMREVPTLEYFDRGKIKSEAYWAQTVLMKADTFLRLAPLSGNRFSQSKYDDIRARLGQSPKLAVPYLFLDVVDTVANADDGFIRSGTLSVESHEGRHRAKVMRDLDTDALMPVQLRFKQLDGLPESAFGRGLSVAIEDGRLVLRGPRFRGMPGSYATTFEPAIRQQYSASGGDGAEIGVTAGFEGADIVSLWEPEDGAAKKTRV